ncbi:MAG: SDR family NAD(P)-dependent oxidoreductase [Alphaproteobacteria bacterium]|nr:SDR family NAD(P)-dependent oxidoreductase [Alphaproteobacteria bacterium]
MKTILITGATSGIGYALAKHYAQNGARLILTGRNPDRLQDVAEVCRDLGAEVHSAIMDVRARDVMSPWLVDMDRRFQINLLIANAGVSGGTGSIDGSGSEDDQQLREIFDINVNGVINTVTPLLNRMRERGIGQIAIMSSLASFSAWPTAPAYAASKAAVRVYGESLRGAYKKDGVKVNVICPGFIKTPMTDVNPYKMPFLMDADKAASIIAKALDKNKGRIAFPWPTYLFAGFIGLLPASWALSLLAGFPKKPARQAE